MAKNQFDKMLGDWKASREKKQAASDSDGRERRRIAALIPYFWEAVIEPIRAKFDTFNEEVGNDNAFSLKSDGDYSIQATKESYPRAEFSAIINPDFPMLSLSGNTGRKKFHKAYFLKRDDAIIYLEEANPAAPNLKRHVPTENLEDETLIPFLSSVLESLK